MTHELKSGTAKVTAEVVIRDKHGNVKYAGPLVMNVIHAEPEAPAQLDEPKEP